MKFDAYIDSNALYGRFLHLCESKNYARDVGSRDPKGPKRLTAQRKKDAPPLGTFDQVILQLAKNVAVKTASNPFDEHIYMLLPLLDFYVLSACTAIANGIVKDELSFRKIFFSTIAGRILTSQSDQVGFYVYRENLRRAPGSKRRDPTGVYVLRPFTTAPLTDKAFESYVNSITGDDPGLDRMDYKAFAFFVDRMKQYLNNLKMLVDSLSDVPGLKLDHSIQSNTLRDTYASYKEGSHSKLPYSARHYLLNVDDVSEHCSQSLFREDKLRRRSIAIVFDRSSLSQIANPFARMKLIASEVAKGARLNSFIRKFVAPVSLSNLSDDGLSSIDAASFLHLNRQQVAKVVRLSNSSIASSLTPAGSIETRNDPFRSSISRLMMGCDVHRACVGSINHERVSKLGPLRYVTVSESFVIDKMFRILNGQPLLFYSVRGDADFEISITTLSDTRSNKNFLTSHNQISMLAVSSSADVFSDTTSGPLISSQVYQYH